jgi:hypothetical protein
MYLKSAIFNDGTRRQLEVGGKGNYCRDVSYLTRETTVLFINKGHCHVISHILINTALLDSIAIDDKVTV